MSAGATVVDMSSAAHGKCFGRCKDASSKFLIIYY